MAQATESRPINNHFFASLTVTLLRWYAPKAGAVNLAFAQSGAAICNARIATMRDERFFPTMVAAMVQTERYRRVAARATLATE